MSDDRFHILSTKGLMKSYGKKQVLKGLDFTLETGSVVGFLGPNGAGKTTAFYSVMGFIRPDAGIIKIDDSDITHLPMFKRARLGISYLPQETSIFGGMTVLENLLVVIESRIEFKGRAKTDEAYRILDELDIADRAKQKANTLSGGEKRRAEIARALALDPKFLLLDEPFAGIDPKAVYEIKQIILHLAKRNIGVLITDHNVRDTLEITDHSYIISSGKVAVAGSREELIDNELARDVYLGDDFRF